MNKKNLIVQILALERIIYNDSCNMLILPSWDGVLAILPKHLPMVIKLKFGIVEIRRNGETVNSFTIDGGIARIYPQGVDIIAMFVMSFDQIDKLNIINRINEIDLKISNKDLLSDSEFLSKEQSYLTANLELLNKLKK